MPFQRRLRRQYEPMSHDPRRAPSFTSSGVTKSPPRKPGSDARGLQQSQAPRVDRPSDKRGCSREARAISST